MKGVLTKKRRRNNAASKDCWGRKSFRNCNAWWRLRQKLYRWDLLPGHNEMLLSWLISKMQVLLPNQCLLVQPCWEKQLSQALEEPLERSNSVYVVVNFFISHHFCFSFVSTSLAYITIPKNKTKTKITWDKKLTTASTLAAIIYFVSQSSRNSRPKFDHFHCILMSCAKVVPSTCTVHEIFQANNLTLLSLLAWYRGITRCLFVPPTYASRLFTSPILPQIPLF